MVFQGWAKVEIKKELDGKNQLTDRGIACTFVCQGQTNQATLRFFCKFLE